MDDRRFWAALLGIVSLGTLSTAALTIYTFWLYRGCSILTILANGG